jgi:hypothetical protein
MLAMTETVGEGWAREEEWRALLRALLTSLIAGVKSEVIVGVTSEVEVAIGGRELRRVGSLLIRPSL